MKQKITLIKKSISLFLLFFTINIIHSQNDNGTIDVAGDIAIIAFNKIVGPPSKSDYAFLLLDDCTTGTSIVFDDDEWLGSAFASATGEGANTWVNNTGSTIPAGTVIQVSSGNNLPTVNIGSVTESDAGFNLAAGDQLYAYFGTRAAPTTFLAFYGELAPTSGETAVLTGTGLVAGSTAIESSNLGYYSGSTVCNGSLTDCLNTISNSPTGWTSGSFSFPTGIATSFSGSSFATTSTWTGTTNNDWNTATNWDTNSVPMSSSDVIIPSGLTNYPTISSAVTVNSITINSGASLIANAAVTGNVTYKRTLTNNWHLVSSPVNGETVQDLIANHTFAVQGGSNITMAPYNNNGSAWIYYTNSSLGSITPGTGLSAKLSAAADLSFIGTINTSNVPYNITQGTANNYNLVGNPFTSYINLGTFFTDNNGKFSEGTIWMWNQAANKYDLKMSVANASFQIAPGQGFFVSAGSNTSINFNTTNQSHQTDTFQRSSRTEINLIATENGKSKSTKIYYVNGATKGFDFGYDGSMFNTSNRFALYSQLVSENQGKNYAIQSLPINEIENIAIPIGLNAKAGKKIDLSITSINLPNNTKVYIEDRVNNKFIDITDTNHSITLKNDVNGIGRFYLHTSSKKLDTPVATIIEDVSFYKSAPNTLSVAGLQSQKASLKIYSLIGQKVVDKNFKSNGFSTVTIPSVSAGVYIVELSSELGKISKKIVLE